jgi:hypothetical protein
MHPRRPDPSSHLMPGGIRVMKASYWKACLALAALPLLGMTTSIPPVRAESNCFNVSGTLTTNPGGGFTVTGDLAGMLFVRFFDLQPSGDGALHASAGHHWVTALGDLYDVDEVVLAPVAPPVYHVDNRMTIVGGTGIFAGATGSIHVQGLTNFATGEVDIVYHGRICLQ